MTAHWNTEMVDSSAVLEIMQTSIPKQVVLDYQAKTIAAAPSSTRLGRLLYRLKVSPERADNFFSHAAVYSMLLSVVALAFVVGLSDKGYIDQTTAQILAAGFGILIIASLCLSFMSHTKCVYPAVWVEVSWEEHERKNFVPQEVCRKAEVAKTLGMELFVLELRQGQFLIDPILVGRKGSEEHYYDIWIDGVVITNRL